MTQTITLAVDGMTCASCVSRSERVLRAQAGVVAASVNLATQRAHVSFDDPADAGALAAALTRAGYAAAVVQGQVTALPTHAAGRLWRKTALAGALTLPVFVVEMGAHLWPALHHLRMGAISDTALARVEMALIGLVLAWPGRTFFTKGVPALLRAAPDMNALVAMGAGAAYAYSAVATFAQTGGAIYYEAAGVTVTLILLGRALEARAKGAAGAAIARLIDLQPQTALRMGSVGNVEVPIAALAAGDVILVRAGERLPADGVVLEGVSSIDTAMLTGEAMPVSASIGDRVVGGCINGAGALQVQITAAGAASTLARITQMVSDAQASKLPVQDMVDGVTRWFVPTIMALAALTLAVWLLAGAGLGAALIHSVAVLIIACPCAMGLAVPVSILVGTGRGAQMGALFRGGAGLQKLARVQTVAFDKTGTLTLGRPRIVGALNLGGALAIAAGIEAQSTHPLARAILDYAQGEAVAPAPVRDVQLVVGKGAKAQLTGGEVWVGSAKLMPPLPPEFAAFAARAETAGQGLIFVAQGAQVIGAFAAEDSVKPNAAAAIAHLQSMGLHCVMLTGDSPGVAARIGALLGITDIRASLLPQDKAEEIAGLGPNTAFVGDGINDAPALARADVGIAMGTGTDVAIEAGDVVLMGGDLEGIARAIGLSRAVMRNISQNLIWAFGYNAALVPVAMGALVPFGGPALSPMLGALAMAASSIFVLANALRLRQFPISG
jgi:Cu+-exporting ATPase